MVISFFFFHLPSDHERWVVYSREAKTEIVSKAAILIPGISLKRSWRGFRRTALTGIIAVTTYQVLFVCMYGDLIVFSFAFRP